MTRSGQGDEAQYPAARPAHEGVVLPADGSEPWIPGVSGEQVAPAGGAPWGSPWGPEQGQDQQAPGRPQPYAQPLPPQQPHHQAQPLPPQEPQMQYQDQSLPPYDAGAAGQLPGQYGQMGEADATQYIAPVQPPAGAHPHENPAESTQFLGVRPAAEGGDAEATQYLPPVPQGAPYGVRPGAPGDRQPPAEFDNLFRSEGAPAGGGAEATQYLPPVPQQPQQSYAPTPQYQPAYEPPYAPEPPQRRSSRVPLIAAVVVGCAVLGLGASALMFGGGDDNKGQNDDKTVAAATSAVAGVLGVGGGGEGEGGEGGGSLAERGKKSEGGG
ncbi:hypothetical protein [Streptomyces sp. NPDC059909]|uniref:hypothetical protein n=1 Tax=Streptomyces sp. NPDC059909 TaxID=3346998 RepID=UPI00365B92E9